MVVAELFAIIKIPLHILYMDSHICIFISCHGFPCQLFQLSWNVYFILFCVLFFSFFVFLLWRKYKNISTFVNEFKSSLKRKT